MIEKTSIPYLIRDLNDLSDDVFDKAEKAAAERTEKLDQWCANHCSPEEYDDDARSRGLITFEDYSDYIAALNGADSDYLTEASMTYGVDEDTINLFEYAAQAEIDYPESIWPHLAHRNPQ